MNRPIVITALAIIGFLYATILLVSGIMVLVGGAVSLTIARPLGSLGPATGALLLAGAVLDLAAAYGLWTLRRWGWALSVALLVLNLIFDVVRIVAGGAMISSALAFIASGVILWYLLLPSTRAVFEHPENARRTHRAA